MAATSRISPTDAAWTSISFTSTLVLACVDGDALIYVGADSTPELTDPALPIREGETIDLTDRATSSDNVRVRALSGTATLVVLA